VFLLQTEVTILALALVIITAEETTHAEKGANTQAKEEDAKLREESRKEEEISLRKEEEVKQQQQEINKLAEEAVNECKQKKNVSEFEEEHQDKKTCIKPQKNEQGHQLQEERNQHIEKQQRLNVDIKQTQDEAEVLELQHGTKERNNEENDGKLKERKHTSQGDEPLEQKDVLTSLQEHSHQQTAQSSGMENRQQDRHMEYLSDGYRVTEPEHDEEHQAESQTGFNYSFRNHEDQDAHTVHDTFNSLEDSSLSDYYDVHTLTLSDNVHGPQHFPLYTPQERHVPYPTENTVPHSVKQHAFYPAPVTVHKAVPYTVHRPVPYPVKVPVERPYPVHVPVEKKIPFAVHVAVPVLQPYTVHVPKPYAVVVEKKVPAPYPVHIEVPVSQPYPVKVKVPVPVPVDRPVPIPVKVPVDRPVPVPVEKPYPVPVEKEIHCHVEKEVPYPVKVRGVIVHLFFVTFHLSCLFRARTTTADT